MTSKMMDVALEMLRISDVSCSADSVDPTEA